MNGYEKILYQMRKQGQKDNPTGVQLGEIGKNLTCTVGTLTLEAEDLLINEMLLTGYTDKDGTAVAPLKKGDAVLVKRLSAQKYAVICRVKEGG